MRSGSFSILDWVAVAGYVLVILGIGFWGTRQSDTSDDYFLAGRSISWPLTGLSLFATNMSGSTLVGLMGGAYQMGLVIYNYEWTAVVALLVLIFFFLPVYRRLGITTAPAFLEYRFDVRTRKYFSALALTGNVLIDMAGTLYAGAIVMRVVLPTLSLEVCVGVLALLAGMYAIAGGLRAAVYTDVLQGVLLLAGTACVSAAAYWQVGGWGAVESATAPSMRNLILPANSEVLPWPSLCTGLMLLGVYYWCINQVMVQRTMAACSLDEARRGALLAGVLKLPVLILMVMPGLLALVLYPDLQNPDLVFPTLAFDLLPSGLRGLVLVSFVAAVMSSVDSVLNSASALLTMDFYAALRPEASECQLVLVGRIVAAVVLVLGAAIAPQIAQFSSLWTYLQSALSYLTPPIVAVFLGGLFVRRVNHYAAFSTLVAGSLLALVLLFIDPGLHFLYTAGLLFLTSLVAMGGVSYFTSTWTVETPDSAVMWQRSDADIAPKTMTATALLLIAIAVTVGALW
ncbi:SSS family solute:Na+ symporter [Salinibacter ruber]|uniref:sodium:solute symporter n=1 Tax=Salinibacter ruber TaxID=146919 RepID=UPI002167FD05|nr:sodium:solute symporter [Salinibacter ruber]MCS3675952.1 SSS family solute:Na+ symporter [Salinibacter ruber]